MNGTLSDADVRALRRRFEEGAAVKALARLLEEEDKAAWAAAWRAAEGVGR